MSAIAQNETYLPSNPHRPSELRRVGSDWEEKGNSEQSDQDAIFDVSTFTQINAELITEHEIRPILPIGIGTTVESIKQKFPDPSVLPQLASQESWGVKQELGEESGRILAERDTSPASPRSVRDWIKSNSRSDNPRPSEVVETLRSAIPEADRGIESPLRRTSEAQRGGLKLLSGLPVGMNPDKPDFTSGEEHAVWIDRSTNRAWKVIRRTTYGKSRNLRTPTDPGPSAEWDRWGKKGKSRAVGRLAVRSGPLRA